MPWATARRAGEVGVLGFEMGLEYGEHARHCDQDGDALAVDGVDDAGGGDAVFEVDFGGEDGRDPQAHGLAEDVA